MRLLASLKKILQPKDSMRLLRWMAVIPALLVTMLFFVIPLLRVFQISFYRNVRGALMEPAITFENYARFLGDAFYLDRLAQTLTIGVTVTSVCFLLGFPLAYTLVRGQLRGRQLLLGVVLYPLVTNALVLVFSWFVLLGNQGPINQLLLALMGDSVRILGTPWAVTIGMIHAGMPFMVIPIMAAISNIPPSLEDAAANLGAPRSRVLLEVVLPLAVPGVASGAIITFATVLSGFLFPLYLGGNSTNIVPLLIFENVSVVANWPFGAAITFIAFLLMLILIAVGWSGISLARRLSGEGVT